MFRPSSQNLALFRRSGISARILSDQALLLFLRLCALGAMNNDQWVPQWIALMFFLDWKLEAFNFLKKKDLRWCQLGWCNLPDHWPALLALQETLLAGRSHKTSYINLQAHHCNLTVPPSTVKVLILPSMFAQQNTRTRIRRMTRKGNKYLDR